MLDYMPPEGRNLQALQRLDDARPRHRLGDRCERDTCLALRRHVDLVFPPGMGSRAVRLARTAAADGKYRQLDVKSLLWSSRAEGQRRRLS